MTYWATYNSYMQNPMEVFLKPSEIFYSQDSIASRFRDGRSVKDAAILMVHRKLDVEDFPTIQVIKRSNGKYYSLDNRRLYVFRVGQYHGVVAKVPVTIVTEQWYHQQKFTSKNGGTKIRVRRGITYSNWKPSWNETVKVQDRVASRHDSAAQPQRYERNQYKGNTQAAPRPQYEEAATKSRASGRPGYPATAVRGTSSFGYKAEDILSALQGLNINRGETEVQSRHKRIQNNATVRTVDVAPSAKRQGLFVRTRPITTDPPTTARDHQTARQREIDRLIRKLLLELDY